MATSKQAKAKVQRLKDKWLTKTKSADTYDLSNPIIITDSWGMRSVYYPGESEPLEDSLTKDFYKPELLAIRKLVNPGNTVIDIGANVGLFSVFLSQEVDAKGQIFAFEPVPQTFNRLRENLALNVCDNVKPYQQAVSNKSETRVMNIFTTRYSAWNTFGKPTFDKIKPISTERVQATTLDSFAKENSLKRLDFVKIDVEGFELDVLEGAKRLLKNNQIKYLSFEVSEIPLKGGNRTAQDVFDLLKSYGYLAYEFDPKSKKFHGPINGSDAFYQNYYASRGDLRKL